jgi:hypothetical protein
MSFFAQTSVTLAAALALAVPAAAVTVVDGGLQDRSFASGSLWQASDGIRSFHLDARGAGSIVQRISGFTPALLNGFTVDVSAAPFDPANQPLDTLGLSALPDATTWMLLLTGFASVGALSRQRRARRPMVAA